jgi:hypothetical protein
LASFKRISLSANGVLIGDTFALSNFLRKITPLLRGAVRLQKSHVTGELDRQCPYSVESIYFRKFVREPTIYTLCHQDSADIQKQSTSLNLRIQPRIPFHGTKPTASQISTTWLTVAPTSFAGLTSLTTFPFTAGFFADAEMSKVEAVNVFLAVSNMT